MSTDSQQVRQAQKRRSRAGLLITVILLPLLIGVLACFPPMPVPLGDPENSLIDPTLSGVWIWKEESVVMVLDPYDKRSWLMSYFSLEPIQDSELESDLEPSPELDLAPTPGTEKGTNPEPEPPPEQDLAHESESGVMQGNDEPGQETPLHEVPLIELLRANKVEIADVSLWKCWLTEIEGETFMTWELKTLSETLPDMIPDFWWAFRLRREGTNTIYLDFFNTEDDSLTEVKSSEEIENIIRRNMKDPEFFSNSTDEGFFEFHKVSESDYESVSELIEEFGIMGNVL